MAIKQLLELIGDDVVIAKFGKVQKAGTEMMSSINKSSADLKLNVDAKPLQEFTGHATKLSDILKVLKPALNEAGASVGGLGAFARVAGLGMTGLAAAVGGAVVVKLADLEEATANTKTKLSDLFGSTANGEKAFNAINTAAGNLHTTVTALLPAVESLARGLEKFNQTGRTFKIVGEQPPGAQQDPEKQAAAIETFIKILRASGQDFDKAEQTANEFFAALGAGGKLTADILNKLPTGAIVLLAEALGKGKVNAAQFTDAVDKLGGDNIDKINKSLANFREQASIEFNLKAVLSYKDALVDLKKAAEDLLKESTGKGFSDFLTGEINAVTKGLQDAATEIRDAAAFITTTWETIKRPFQFLSGGGQSATEDQTQLVQSFREAGGQSAAAFVDGFAPVTPQILSIFQSLRESIVALFSTPIPVNLQAQSGFFGTPFGFAGGGMIRGPGTTTSDSIMAFLSNWEFVQPARAVQYYGLEFMEAIRQLKLPRDFVGRFAMGGLARSVSGNRFAGGGQVRSGNPVILKIDRQTFNMTAGDDTVAALKRFSVAAQLASTGRKPSWVK